MSDDAMRTQQKIELLLYVSKTVNEKLDLDHVFSSIMDRAKEVMKVQRATLFLFDEERDELWSKLVMDGGVVIRVPTNAGFVGHAFTSGTVLNVPDAYEDPRFNTRVDLKTGFRTKAVLCNDSSHSRILSALSFHSLCFSLRLQPLTVFLLFTATDL